MNTVTPKNESLPTSSNDVKIIAPDFALKKLIGENVDIKQLFSAENIEKAQSVIDTHKENFLEWIKSDLATLEECYQKASLHATDCAEDIKKLAKAAFVIKSQAGTFGYSLATSVAKSLDDFCLRDFQPSAEHLTVIRKHIDALQAIFSKQISGDGGILGEDLSRTLSKLVTKFRTPN